MTQIILDANASSELEKPTQPVEVCDQSGRVLGKFVPSGLPDNDVLATGEMVDRIMAEDDANDPYLDSYQTHTRKESQ